MRLDPERRPTLPPSVRRLFRLAPDADRAATELDEELAFHLEERTAELRRLGLTDVEARAEALRRLGDVGDLREYCGALAQRRARRHRVMEWCGEWMRDVRFAARQLGRAPGFTAVAVLTLALGIGANTAIFSAVHHLLIAPLPYPDVDRVVIVEQVTASQGPWETPGKLASAVVANTRAFAAAGTYVRASYTLDVPDGRAILGGAALDANVLRTVGMQPILGRAFVADDTLPGAPHVMLLSEALWRTRFGADPGVLGRTVMLSEQPTIVVGVMPRGFTLPWTAEDDLWTPLVAGTPRVRTDIIARLRPGVSMRSAALEVARVTAPYEKEAAAGGLPQRTVVNAATSEKARVVRADGLRTALLILFVVVGVLLLIACANVANLMLTRTTARQRELAVRAALGAGRARLLRLVLTESVLLGVLGGAAGVVVGWQALHVIIALRPHRLDELSGVHLEWPVLWWTLCASLIAPLLFGLAPALLAGREEVATALRSDARTTTGSRSAKRFRATMVSAEMALSVVLLVCAGLLVRSVLVLEDVDPGVDTRGLDVVHVSFRRDRVATPEGRTLATSRLLDVVRALPGVRAASVALAPPPYSAGSALGGLEVDGRTYAPGQASFGINLVDPQYFRTVGLSLRAGRVYAGGPRDTSFRMARDVVVSESFAHEFWPRGNALGHVLRGVPSGPVMTVVGVVSDERAAGPTDFDHHAQLYSPLAFGQSMISLLVRSPEPIGKLTPAITGAIASADVPIRIWSVTTADAGIAANVAPSRFLAILLGCFAALAFAMAMIGLYGVISYTVGQRRHELGLRLALGASARDLVRLVVADGVRLAGAGVVLGVAGAALATRALRSMLFGVRSGDALTYTLVIGLLLATALVAAYMPARQAGRADPLHTLRAD